MVLFKNRLLWFVIAGRTRFTVDVTSSGWMVVAGGGGATNFCLHWILRQRRLFRNWLKPFPLIYSPRDVYPLLSSGLASLPPPLHRSDPVRHLPPSTFSTRSKVDDEKSGFSIYWTIVRFLLSCSLMTATYPKTSVDWNLQCPGVYMDRQLCLCLCAISVAVVSWL